MPCICDDKDKLIGQYGTDNVRDETPIDQTTNDGAVISMRRRIQQVLNNCIKCTDTDRFIAAALAQDAQLNMSEMEIASRNGPASNHLLQETNGLNIDWIEFFDSHKKTWNKSYEQVIRFDDSVTELNRRGWAIPNLVRAGIDSLRISRWTFLFK